MSYITPSLFARVVSLPISLPQTELRRGKSIHISSDVLADDQILALKSLNLHVLKILTPGVVPVYASKVMGVVSVGIYDSPMLCSGGCLVRGYQVGVTQFNPWQTRLIYNPGTYTIVVSNNTTNVDVDVCVTGSIKLYL